MALDLNHIILPASGAEITPPLVIAHGLFGSARNFNSLGRKLAVGRRVILADMRNHGASPWGQDVSYRAMADDLARLIRSQAGGRAIVLGHSMGGKSAMALSLTHTDMVAAAIIADIAPIQYSHTHLGILQAMRAADLSGITRRSDGDALMAAALPDPMLRSFILQNLVVEDGQARWRLNVEALEDGMDDLIGWPEALSALSATLPVLSIFGGASDYVGPTAQSAITRHFPRAEFHEIHGAGHWLHAEEPADFWTAVQDWLAKHQ